MPVCKTLIIKVVIADNDSVAVKHETPACVQTSQCD